MKWDEQAQNMIQAAPAMVQTMIRKRLEQAAAARGLTRVSEQFVKDQMPGRHGASGGDEQERPPFELQELYANEDSDPLTKAFAPTQDVHVFGGGQSLEDQKIAGVWERVSQQTPKAEHPRCLYIHFPFCRSRCSFCPFYANRWQAEASHAYVDALLREIEITADLPVGQARFDAVYFGGGTPSDMAPEDMTRMLRALRERLQLAPDVEITLEGRVWGQGEDVVAAALDGGVNRFSIGVQSFDTPLRQSLGRHAERAQVLRFLETLSAGPAAVVIDLIYGLPGQTMDGWLEDLRTLCDETLIHGVDLYRLKSLPGSVMEEQISAGHLPARADLAESATLFSAGVERMSAEGWERLTVPHWRRDRRERNRYNTFVKAGAECLPIGCGAGGRVGPMRVFQISDLEQYTRQVNAGRKPLASASLVSPVAGLNGQALGQIEQMRLAPEEWRGATDEQRSAARRLFEQWTRAGLLRLEAPSDYRLTVAGQFWSVQMGARLVRLIEAPPVG